MELNPFSYQFHEDPYPTYRWLRERAPAYHNERLRFWALSRYRDVLEASKDWATYSSAEGTTLERVDPALGESLPMMIFMDPPRHDRLRKLVNQVFTPRRVAELEPSIRATAVRHLEPVVEKGGGDFVKEFSALLPMHVIFTLLGVPSADRRMLREWIDESLFREPDSPKMPERAIRAMTSSATYWFELVAERRRHPGDDFISRLIEAEVESDGSGTERLTDAEVVGFCSLLGAAGNETVTKLLANAVVLMGRNPSEHRKVLENPGRIPDLVEETLRYTSPSQYQGRVLTRDVHIHDRTIPKGSRVLLLTASANRDEREYAEPDRFDIDRPPHIALGFGFGVHACLGTALARLESRVALEEFDARFPRFEIDERSLERVHMSNVHGFSTVPFHRT
jgi:cytochrome P450